MAYASYARGFKSGGINMSGLPLDNSNQPGAGDRGRRARSATNTYEVGLKNTLFDRRLIFNIDGFYTKVHDFQATVVDNSLTQTVQLRGYLSNIPEVTVKGIEADVTALSCARPQRAHQRRLFGWRSTATIPPAPARWRCRPPRRRSAA